MFYSMPNDFAVMKLKYGESGVIVNQTRGIKEYPFGCECMVDPIPVGGIRVGDVALAMVGGKLAISRIVATKAGRYKFGNDTSAVGWAPRDMIYGIVKERRKTR